MTGLLLLDKPPGPSSHDAVVEARRSLGVRRIGHFGTLDPFASGLLVLGVGPATRLAPFCVDHGKRYRARVRLGWESDTGDAEGRLAPTGAVRPERAAVEAACARWVGQVDQVPPVYSAKHVEGRRAYARARAGEAVALEPARVRIDRIRIDRYDWPDLEITVDCGPGTYLRALARDLGEMLDVGGYCAELRRLRSGPFGVERALAWDDLRCPERVRTELVPAEDAVRNLPAADLSPTELRAVANGRIVAAPAGLAAGAGWIRLRGDAGFVGLAEPVERDGGVALQPRKILYPEGERAWNAGGRS